MSTEQTDTENKVLKLADLLAMSGKQDTRKASE